MLTSEQNQTIINEHL